MTFDFISKKFRRNYVSEITEKENYLIAKYADGSKEMHHNNAEAKEKLVLKSEEAIANCGIKKRIPAYLHLGFMALSGVAFFALGVAAVATLNVPGLSLMALTALSGFGMILATVCMESILSTLDGIKKGKYFIKNKDAINKGIAKEVEKNKDAKSYVISKDSPYNCIARVTEKTGDTKLNIMNVVDSDLTLRELKKMKKAAELVKAEQLKKESFNGQIVQLAGTPVSQFQLTRSTEAYQKVKK